MKTLSVGALFLFTALSVQAQVSFLATSTTGVGLAALYGCSIGEVDHCMVASGTTAALASSVLAVNNKQELKAVEDDALKFLAGDVLTEALEEVINKTREGVPELEKLSDELIAILFLQSLSL